MITTLLASTLSLLPAPQEPLNGAFMNAPLVVTGDVQGVPSPEILYAGPGAPAEEFGAHDSRFFRSAIFKGHGSGMQLGSISSGGALITAVWNGSNGGASLASAQWCFQVYSVTSATRGEVGSIYDRDSATVGGNVYSFIAPGSQLPAEYVGEVHKIRDAGQMGLSEVRGIDCYMNALLLGGAGPGGNPRLYFTVTNATKQFIPWHEWHIAQSDAQPSTIFKVEFDGEDWGTPVVYRRWSDLGFQNDGIEIDALCVDDVDPEGHKILLSTTELLLERQLWLVWPLHSYAGAYYNAAGDTRYVEAHLGFVTDLDGIDGLCADDPVRNDQARDDRHRQRARLNGIPILGSVNPNDELRFGVHRERIGDSAEYYRMTLTHHASPMGVLATAHLTLDSLPDEVIGYYVRNTNQTVDPITHLAPCPNEPSILGHWLRFHWRTHDAQLNEVARTYVHELYR